MLSAQNAQGSATSQGSGSKNGLGRHRAKIITLVLLSVSVVAGALLGHQWLQSQAASDALLGASDRYRVHVSTDKPIYREGETAYFRAVILDAFTHKSATTLDQSYVSMKVIGPKGETVMSGHAEFTSATAGASWAIPTGQLGGQYKVNFSADGPFSASERTFEIRAYRAPKLRAQLEFTNKAYGPSDTVTISAKVTRSEGGVPTKAKVTSIARVDGVEVFRNTSEMSAEGVVGSSYSLPNQIAVGEGTHTFIIEDGGVVESFSKTIPLLLQKLDIAVYPEGGDLIAGVENVIYVQAYTPWGDPADFQADVLDESGKFYAKVATEHEGRGRTTFKPEAGRKYHLSVTKPFGITTKTELPVIRESGAVLRASKTAYASGEGVEFVLASTVPGSYRLSLYRHEREVSATMANLDAGGSRTVTLSPPSDISGVLRATLFDADEKPVAERLIYRAPMYGMKIEVKADREVYTPGDQVNVTIKTTDNRGRPVQGIVGITVTDDAVLEMIETRRQSPRLPAMVLIEGDVNKLEDATVYLDGTAKGETAIDLLLGTQGWRRFAFMDVKSFMDKHGDAGKRAVAYYSPTPSVSSYWRGARTGVARRAGGDPEADEVDGVREMAGADGAPAAEAPDENAAKADPGNKPGAQDRRNDEQPGVEDGARDRAVEGAKELEEVQDEAGRGPIDRRMDDDEGEVRRERARIPARQRPNFISIREYAHMLRAGRKPGDRRDFSETLYWNAGLKTGVDGTAKFTFFLSDSISSFRVMVDGHSATGLLGSSDLIVESKQPFAIEPKMPLEVTQGDVIQLPIALVNNMASSAAWTLKPTIGAAFQLRGIELNERGELVGTLDPLQRGSVTLPLRVVGGAGTYELSFAGTGGPYTDSVTRSVSVKPYGFPTTRGAGGMLKADGAKHTITIPDSVVPGSVKTFVKVYPTPMANLTAALERLIQEPYGCFEQASSVVYPMIMAQQYFRSHVGVDPALIARTNDMLDKGYRKLTGYEVRGGGYEWFGGAPAHEALTAYGVLEFHDMSKVYPVDPAMLERTKKWLLERRDGSGSFTLNPRALDSFGGAPQNITNAYIVWSLTESGYSTLLDKEIDKLEAEAKVSKDPYLNGLVAGAMYNAGRRDGAIAIMKSLGNHQHADGSVIDATTSITRSSGDALTIETTSVAILAWLKDDQFTDRTERAMNWLSTRCQNGRFGSTQSTILALKAIVAYDAARAAPKKPGQLVLRVNGAPIGNVIFDEKTKGVIELPDFASMLAPGRYEIDLSMIEGSPMPYSLQVDYHADTPASSPNCAVDVVTGFSTASGLSTTHSIREGETVDVRVSITNKSPVGQPMTTAIIGLPGGLEPRYDQLRELVEAKIIDFYEVRGREVIVYLRAMAPKHTVEFRIDCVAAIPGTYTGPASRAYLYYADEHKHWVDGLKVTVAARE